jgi:signal peptide peptidase SppA
MSVPKVTRIHSSVIAAFLNTTWAIDPQWLDNAWSFLSSENTQFDASSENQEPSLLSAIAGERPQGTRYTVVPENSRTAIIEIWGAIMPRANMYTEYCGGTSAELLVRDIKAANANPNIDEVKFIVHSPGGDVVGVTEVNDAILELNKTKNTTAYIKGTCASAAVWMASACKRMVANRTAMIGSIGVYTVYIDRTKAMEAAGYKEIIIKSDQSPDKNPDPATTRGAELIKIRVSDLCDEFILDMSKNRKVSVETVTKNFGKGDVMISKRALKAGLIDAIGTFDAASAEIAEIDGSDNFQDDETPEEEANSNDSTINSSSDLNSQSTSETDTNSANTDNQNSTNGDFMTDKEKKDAENNNPAANAADLEANQQSAAANDGQPAAGGAKPEEKGAALVTGNGTDATFAAQLKAANDKIAVLEAKELKTELTAIANDFAGEKENHISTLTDLSGAFGKDSPQVKNYIETQKALTAQINEGGLFTEKGKSGASGDAANGANASDDKITALAKERAKAKNITVPQAYSEILSEDPSLYNA